jgi:hypothetical protein
MKILVFLFLFSVVGHINRNNQKIHIKEQTIKELSSFNFNLPSPDIALYLFVRSSDGRLGRLNIIALHNIYVQLFSKSKVSFKAFLVSTLNEKTAIDSEILKKKGALAFSIDEKITGDCKALSLFKFESKYCDSGMNGHFVIKEQYYKDTQKLYSIMYYFFINNYKVLSDDNLGESIVIR